jgi:hypothetical protein
VLHSMPGVRAACVSDAGGPARVSTTVRAEQHMNGSAKIRTCRLRKRSVAFYVSLVICGFCGCSTVQPELTPEEVAYDKQLKQQGNGKPSPTADMNFGQKVVYYLCYPIEAAAYGIASGRGNTDHH